MVKCKPRCYSYCLTLDSHAPNILNIPDNTNQSKSDQQ